MSEIKEAILAGVDSIVSTTASTATYRLTPPGGTGDSLDYGAYRISVQPNSIQSSESGLGINGALLGKFFVRIDDDPSTIYVTSFDDTPFQSNPSSTKTLRQAIVDANAANPDPRTIILEPGNYVMKLAPVIDNTNVFAAPREEQLLDPTGSSFVETIGSWSNELTGDLDITGDLTIVGDLPSSTRIDAKGVDLVFKVHPGSSLQLSRLRSPVASRRVFWLAINSTVVFSPWAR